MSICREVKKNEGVFSMQGDWPRQEGRELLAMDSCLLHLGRTENVVVRVETDKAGRAGKRLIPEGL